MASFLGPAVQERLENPALVSQEDRLRYRLMRRLGGLVVTGLLTAGAAGCATMSVSSHVERGLDFTQYRTYDWGTPDELPTGDPRLDRDPFFKDHVLGAVEKELGRRGLEMSSSPDLRIHYHASITRRLNVSGVDRTRGYCATENCQAEVSEYEAGTLVIDFVDTRTNKVIWRGWAQDVVADMLQNRDVMERKINEAVTRMLARLPPEVRLKADTTPAR